MTKPVSTDKSKRLKKLKSIVTRTIDSTIECGLALKEIHDTKLYLEEAGSFEEFCQDNWNITRQRGYQLIDSAEIVNELPKDVSTAVDTESAARELKKVPKERRTEVARAAKDGGGKATAPAIAKAAKVMTPEAPKEYDRTGFEIPVPSPAFTTWLRYDEVQEMLSWLSKIKGTVSGALDRKDCMYAEVNYSAAVADLSSAYQQLKVGLPYAVCPTCSGRVLNDCATCMGRGMVSELYWKHKVPEETKKIRERAVNLMVKKGGGKK